MRKINFDMRIHLRSLFIPAAVILLAIIVPVTLAAAKTSSEVKDPSTTKNLSNPTGSPSNSPKITEAGASKSSPMVTGEVPISTGFDYPVGGAWRHEGYDMNNCFGCDFEDYLGHTGEDFDNGQEGGPVYAASEGVVVFTGTGPGAWGNVIIIRHIVNGNNIYTQYAHVRDIFVSQGQGVGRRQQIATVGTTGTSAPHLHFEVKDQPVIGHGYTGKGFSNINVLSAWGITYYAPSWWLENHRLLACQPGDVPPETVPDGRHYFWSWFDNSFGRNWVLMANPVGGGMLSFDLNISGRAPKFSFSGGPAVDSGQVIHGRLSCLFRGGPVVATSLTDAEAIVSQRVLWNQNSLEEVAGTSEEKLANHYYWTWYDQLSRGFKNWVLIGNPSSTKTIAASISFKNKSDGRTVTGIYSIPPGGDVTPQFPGTMGGPVEVKAWQAGEGRSWDNEADREPVIASMRVLTNYDDAFNELPGIDAQTLSDHYFWTWYDQKSPGAMNWILIANPSVSETVMTRVSFASQPGSQAVSRVYQIPPGGSITPQFPNNMGGPVEAVAWLAGDQRSWPADKRPVIASQRSIWGPSFEETPGAAQDTLPTSHHWTWYDQQSPGSRNWILVANTNNYPIYYQITIGGSNPGAGSQGVLPAGRSLTPVFPAWMGGPVNVKAWKDAAHAEAAPVLASQRVLWNGYFNEVIGVSLTDF